MIKICEPLIIWYKQNKRDLPWRDTKDPYFIWVSEIILQQTRVDQGLSYYYNFIKEFPEVDSLANASIDKVLKLWQGLGYYSRARNMHIAAKTILEKYNGQFPSEYSELLKLKGIGEYTASAIASFAFNQKVPAIDGNVYRVLSRLFGISDSTETPIGKKVFLKKANEIICQENPGTFNQAMMEFGALQCVPRNPNCSECPFKTICFAYKNNLINELPVKKQKTKQSTRFFNYIYIIYKEYTFIHKRTENDIWKLLYQFPLIETDKKTDIEKLITIEQWKNLFGGIMVTVDPNIITRKHILSHQKLETQFIKVYINDLNDFLSDNYIMVLMADIEQYSIPKLIDNYLNEI